MTIIVDGYNFLKQIFYYSTNNIKGDIDKIRSIFIKNLSFYKKNKGHEIIVVFDGGGTSKATREICEGVIVIFSGYKKSADEWILEYIERSLPGDFLLVSNDRKLIELASNFEADAIDVVSFHKLVLSSINEDDQKEILKKSSSNVHKYSSDDAKASKWDMLDFLIAQSDVTNYSKDDLEEVSNKEIDRSHRLSKEEKRMFKKIKKL